MYEKLEILFVGGFIGSPSINFFKGTLLDGTINSDSVSISIPEGKMKYLRDQGYINKEIIIGIRSEEFHDEPVFIESSQGSKNNAKIEVVDLMGAETMLYSQIGNQQFIARVDSHSDFKPGQVISLVLNRNKTHFFDKETENLIQPVGK